MSVTMLFERLSELETRMEKSSSIHCIDQLDKLDRSYDKAWDDVLNYSPKNADLAELMLLMLMDKFAERARAGESVAQIREKILELHQAASDASSPVAATNPNLHASAGTV